VRADSGFYADNFLSFLEERSLPYIVVARLTTYLKSRLYQITQWQALDAIYSVSEFRFKLWNWKSERRFVVVREQLQTNKPAVGRKLIDLPSYVFRVFVINRNDSALEIWRDYNGRAAVECRIDELKNELVAIPEPHPLVLSRAEPDRSKGRFDRIGGVQMRPVLAREVVESKAPIFIFLQALGRFWIRS
jgi:hypothetical protein